jgi:hypothetical protein
MAGSSKEVSKTLTPTSIDHPHHFSPHVTVTGNCRLPCRGCMGLMMAQGHKCIEVRHVNIIFDQLYDLI